MGSQFGRVAPGQPLAAWAERAWAVSRTCVAMCGLLAIVGSRLEWRDEGTGRGFGDEPLDGWFGDTVVMSYVGDGDSFPVPGPGFALASGVLLTAWSVATIVTGAERRWAATRTGAWWACVSLVASGWAHEMEGVGPHVYGIASSIAAVVLVGMLVVEPPPRGPDRVPLWLALAPIPLTAAATICAVASFSYELTAVSALAVLGTCGALGATIALTVLVVRRSSTSRWWLVVPVLLVGLVALYLGAMSIVVAIT